MLLLSPPHIYVDADGPSVNCASTLALAQWYHVAHTYAGSSEKVDINGQLDGSGGSPMTFANPARMWIGGWYNNYSFVGDLDEVRVSKIARSTNWIKLAYQNQNPLQTLVGPLVQPGNTFSVAPVFVTLRGGAVPSLVGEAGGAQKLYWICKKNGQETVIAVDQFTLNLAAGRVLGGQSFVLQFKAIYPGFVLTNDIPVTIQEAVPEPVFTLVPSTNLWDGRRTMTVTPVISNWSALQAAGVTHLNYTWTVAGVAVTKQISPGVLTLLRAQGTGPMTVTLAIDNGGPVITNTATVTVQEPATDAWVPRTPATNEIPVNGQFFARDDTGLGTIYYNGILSQTATNVFMRIYTNGPTGDVLYTNVSQALPGNRGYALSARIAPGLVKYSVRFGYVNNGVAVTNNTVTNLLCGDAYLLEGQSNAVATDGLPAETTASPWISSYGWSGGGWGSAVRNGTEWWIGYWGMDLAANLVAAHKIPLCIINGAVGGTRIDQHQANPPNHYVADSYGNAIYANLLTRVAAAQLTHGIRAILWHQGENNSGAAAPTGDYDYKSYQQDFVELSAAWKQDYPNIQHYYIFQVWPRPCAMGPTGDQLREAQRTLPRLYSNLDIMATVGLSGYLGCHYSAAGYTQIATVIAPLVKRDNYGLVPPQPIMAPDLKRAYYTTTNRNAIALEFGQPIVWNSAATVNFFLDRVGSLVTSGSASGNVIKLQLSGRSTAQTIDYVEDAIWNGNSASLLRGSNGIAALTFADVPIGPPNYAPAINGLSPTRGRTNGGTLVTFTGSNFLSGAGVQFAGSLAAALTVNSTTQLTASTPAHDPGLVNVVVSNTNGLAATNQFTYVLPPAAPTLGNLGLLGTNLAMVGSGGAGQSCVLLCAMNLAQPRSSWTPVTTNIVGPDGWFSNSLPIQPGDPQRFYFLSIPYD